MSPALHNARLAILARIDPSEARLALAIRRALLTRPTTIRGSVSAPATTTDKQHRTKG